MRYALRTAAVVSGSRKLRYTEPPTIHKRTSYDTFCGAIMTLTLTSLATTRALLLGYEPRLKSFYTKANNI